MSAHRATFRLAPTTCSSACSSRTPAASARPNDKRLEPRIAYHHPLLDAKFGIDPHDDSIVWTDDDLERLIDRLRRGRPAGRRGRAFASSISRPVTAICCTSSSVHACGRAASAATSTAARGCCGRSSTACGTKCPGWLSACGSASSTSCRSLVAGTLASVWHGTDGMLRRQRCCPYRRSASLPARLRPESSNPLEIDLAEPLRLLRLLRGLGVAALNISCGSPYYNPHIQRPAIFPPSDGYQPPEDPLVGVCRQIEVARQCKAAVPDVPLVGSGYSYLQEYLPHVAQAVVREGLDRFRRPGPDGAFVSRAAGRHAGRAANSPANASAARSATAPRRRATA